MNKLNSGKTITIKINGEQRPFLEEPKKVEPQSDDNVKELQQYASIEEDHEAIIETAAAQEAEESFDWILPEQDITKNELGLYNAVKGSKQHRGIRLPALSKVEKKNMNISAIKSIGLSVVFAILLGTGFGFIMLKLVITDSSKHAAVETKAPAAETKTPPVTANNSKSQALTTLKPLSAYMVQGGVYSKKETASTVARQTVEKGIPAEIMEWNGQYYIFLGVADSIEHAKKLGSILLNKGADGVFPKTITIPEKKFSNLSADEKTVIENSTALVPLLATISSNILSGGSISSNELKSLNELKSKLTKIDSKGIKNKNIKDLDVEITGAIKQINDYQQKKDHKLLEKAQQHLLTFLAEYYSI